MKKKALLMYLFTFLLAFQCLSQKDKGIEYEVVNKKDGAGVDTIWVRPDRQSSYPGGNSAMYDFLGKTIKDGDKITFLSPKRMMFRLTISDDGKVVDKKIIREVSPEWTEKVMQGVDQFPKLNPAVKNDHNVYSYFLMTVCVE